MKAKIKELRDRQQKIVAEARKLVEEVTDKTTAERAKEIEAASDKAWAEHDAIEKRVAEMERVLAAEEKLAEEATKVPPVKEREIQPVDEPAQGTPEELEKRRLEVFGRFMRQGAGDLSPEERAVLRQMRSSDPRETRAQSVGTDSAGGYTVPQGFLAEIVKSMKAWGPMLDPGITRQLVTSSGNQMEIPTVDDTAQTGALLAENTADSEQDVTLGQKLLDAYKYTSKLIRVSEELLQDSAFDIQSFLAELLGERLGRIGNTHLTTGTGTAQPNGIVTASTLGHTGAANNAITFDELIELVHSVDPAYRTRGARFMMRDSTLKAVRKLKDGQSRYLWEPAVSSEVPATILGHPYSINQDVAAIATTAKSVLFGDFSKYVVRRVRDFILKRLVERYGEFHQVAFVGFMRIDGEILDAAAVKHLAQPV